MFFRYFNVELPDTQRLTDTCFDLVNLEYKFLKRKFTTKYSAMRHIVNIMSQE